MTELVSLEVEGLPPTVNHLYRSANGRRYKTAHGREYQEALSARLRELWDGRPAYTGEVALHITFETADRRRWDIDNRVKALQDCLSMSGIIRDDSQIENLHVERLRTAKNATKITLRVNTHDAR